MNIDLAEKLKTLRKEKGISQEKLANYLNLSFQAVSKWETGNALPDIALLPDIARFFGITIDELLQAQKIDEQKRYEEYAGKAEELFRNGEHARVLEIWLEAYREMPNNLWVKEMLMSSYYDADKVKYAKEIIELGIEIYNSNAPMYCKGQAIREIAYTYAESGNLDMAEKWIVKSVPIFNSQEILFSEVFRGDEMLAYISSCTYWFLDSLFYMANRINYDKTHSMDDAYRLEVYRTVAQVYETVYPNDDMGFESLGQLYLLHERIAEKEISLKNREDKVKSNLERAAECVIGSAAVTEHTLALPLLAGWKVQAAPSDNRQLIWAMLNDLDKACYDVYRDREWFIAIRQSLQQQL